MALITKVRLLKLLDAGPGYLLCKLTGRWRHHFAYPELAAAPHPTQVRHVLVIRPGGMGDMVMLLPMLQALQSACPAARIDVLCEKRNAEVLSLTELNLRPLLYDAHPLRTLSTLRRTAYDLAIDTEQFHNFSALLACYSGATARVGFRVTPARLHLYTHLADYDMIGYEADRFGRLLEQAGIPAPTLSAAGCLGKRRATMAVTPRKVLISPGSSNKYKHWDARRFASLINALKREGLEVSLIGGRPELQQADAILKQLLPETTENLTGRHNLKETLDRIAGAALVIACDSGLAHLAAAAGTPCLALFGPSDPRKWGHPTANYRVLREPLPCSPCASFGYYKLCRDIPCMQAITEARVIVATKELLQQQEGSPL